LAIQEKATSLGIGSKFGAYEVVSHHGAGGMADIWVARKIATAPSSPSAPEITAERFAIKTLLPQRAHRTEYIERFEQEAALHRRFDHPNVIRLIETDIETSARYLVLEFVQGLNLRQMIHAAKPRQLPRSVVFEIMARVCDALDYLHELTGEEGPLGIVHCDVSPENVMIGLDGEVKLIDFGLATATLAARTSDPHLAVVEASVLRPGRHVPPGRLQYLAPERINGGGLDRRGDIYSVGAMLFELVHGKRPFQAHATYDLLTRICQGTTVGGDPSVDPETRDLIEHAMAVLPENRIDRAKHLADALRLLRDLCDPDEPTAGGVVRRLFGLEEIDEIEEIDLLWTEEKATAEYVCLDSIYLDSVSDTPLLEQGTALDVAVRNLLQQTSRSGGRADTRLPAPLPPLDDDEVSPPLLQLDDIAEMSGEQPAAGPVEDAPLHEEIAFEAAAPSEGTVEPATQSAADDAADVSPAPGPPSSEPRSQRTSTIPDLFAPISRARPSSVDLFGAYEKRPSSPASGIFLAQRESVPAAPRESFAAPLRNDESGEHRQPAREPRREDAGPKIVRAAAVHFDAGWRLLRAGKASETLAEWEAAMQLDPSNRSYAVNVQKLRLKLQG
jgi:serine/threonine protein kinase